MERDQLLQEIRELEREMIADRRFLHQHPELSCQEYQTTKFIKERLAQFGILPEPLETDTGVSVLIRGGKPGKTVCIRHDIDALPIQEETGLAFQSEVDGVSHACGHDIHTVIALYCGKLLNERKKELAGNVRIVFQPAEETGTGAREMMEAGFRKLSPANDIVVGLHVHPETPVGQVSLREGAMEAGADYLRIRIKGKGCHGAHPYQGVDPILTAAFLMTELQSVITRVNPAVKPAILTFGSIHGGKVCNVIPDQVELLGTLRVFHSECRELNLQAIRRITEQVCASMGAEGTVELLGGMLPICNDREVAEGIVKAAEEILGEGSVEFLEFPSPGSDDFAVFLEGTKGAQFFLGTGGAAEETRIGIHSGRNVFEEKSIAVGTAVLVQYVMNTLR